MWDKGIWEFSGSQCCEQETEESSHQRLLHLSATCCEIAFITLGKIRNTLGETKVKTLERQVLRHTVGELLQF